MTVIERDAGEAARRRLRVAGTGCLAVAALAYVLTLTGGLDQPVRVAPDGTQTAVTGP